MGPRRLAILLFLGILSGALVWLGGTQGGLTLICDLAGSFSGGKLTIGGVEGRLLGPMRFGAVKWAGQDRLIQGSDIELDWRLEELLQGRLHVKRLAIGGLQMEMTGSMPPPPLPVSLRLPFSLRVDLLELGHLSVNGQELARGLRASLESEGSRYRLGGLEMNLAEVRASGALELASAAPYTLAGTLRLAGPFRQRSFVLESRLGGTLEAIDLSVRTIEGPLEGQGRARITPFAATAFPILRLGFTGVDPADWLKDAPHALLDIDIDLKPRPGHPEQVAGAFRLENRKAGRLDPLPLRRLGGSLEWEAGHLRLQDLRADLTGGGSLSGRGGLEAGTLTLDLEAKALDASLFHRRFRTTHLAGRLKATLLPARQTLSLDLKQADLALRGRLLHQKGLFSAEDIEIRSGKGLVSGSGHFSGGPFQAQGEFVHFDPGPYLHGYAGQLNGRFRMEGSLHPRPDFRLVFQLEPSRLAGLPLSGEGSLDLVWPSVRRADARLSVGENRLSVSGAFGNPGDRLEMKVEVPRLSDLGLDGDMTGSMRLSGTVEALSLEAQFVSRQFSWPGGVGFQGASLEARLGAASSDPLRLDLVLGPARLSPGVTLDAMRWHVEGTRARHHLVANARRGARQVDLEADGGLAGEAGNPRWMGSLTALAVHDPAGEIHLKRAAPLLLGQGAWSLGAAEFSARDWSGRLLASSGGEKLHVEASGEGDRFGRLSASLDATMRGAWTLDQGKDWRGNLNFSLPDLTWLGSLLDLRTGGVLEGQLGLAGSPARPVASGQMQGKKLSVAVPGTGLRLENGRLAASLQGDLLKVDELHFESRMQDLPRALPAAERPVFSALAARPGSLEGHGGIRLGTLTGSKDQVFLDLSLDRVGLIQSADQWMMFSGGARVDWQDGTLSGAGALKVDAGFWRLAGVETPRLSDDVVVTSRRIPTESPRRLRLYLDMTTDLGERFFFNGAGLSSRLAGNVRLVAQGRDLPKASGSIQIVAGTFDAYGQKLAIERGLINFQGLPDNPSLNVRALRKGLAVEAGVEVTGTAKRPVVRLVSDPEVAEAEKLSWLVLGRDSSELGSGDGGILLAAAGSILGGNSAGVVQRLRQTLGVDELGVRSGQLGNPTQRPLTSRVATGGTGAEAGAANQILTVGKRLSSNMSLSYEQALGKAESLVKLTVDLSRRLSLVGRTGSDNALDLFYTWSFGGEPQKGR